MHESIVNRFFGISLATVILTHAVVTAAISAHDWADLNSTTGGHLHLAVPFARPCFQDAKTLGGTFDSTQCTIVMREYTDDGMFFDIPRSRNPNPETNRCSVVKLWCIHECTFYLVTCKSHLILNLSRLNGRRAKLLLHNVYLIGTTPVTFQQLIPHKLCALKEVSLTITCVRRNSLLLERIGLTKYRLMSMVPMTSGPH